MKISLQYIKETFPGYIPTSLLEYKKASGLWVCKVGYTRLDLLGSIEEQLQKVISAGALAVCVRLRNKSNMDVQIPDVSIDKFLTNTKMLNK